MHSKRQLVSPSKRWGSRIVRSQSLREFAKFAKTWIGFLRGEHFGVEFSATKPISILGFVDMRFSDVILKGRQQFCRCLFGISVLGEQEDLATPRAPVSHRLPLGPMGHHELGPFIRHDST
jgi:hypothetical protein